MFFFARFGYTISMYLIAGLGNPGTQYAKTRHNAGFLVVDTFAKEFGFPAYSLDQKANALVAENILSHMKVMLVKPQTMMNASGKAIRVLVQRHGIRDWLLTPSGSAKLQQRHSQSARGILNTPVAFLKRQTGIMQALSPMRAEREPSYLIVVHDDLDLALGKIRISVGSGSAGHRGVESVIQQLGNKDFARIRLGILPKEKPSDVEDFVLKRFMPEEEPIVQQAVLNAVHAIELIVTDGIERAMNKYN